MLNEKPFKALRVIVVPSEDAGEQHNIKAGEGAGNQLNAADNDDAADNVSCW